MLGSESTVRFSQVFQTQNCEKKYIDPKCHPWGAGCSYQIPVTGFARGIARVHVCAVMSDLWGDKPGHSGT